MSPIWQYGRVGHSGAPPSTSVDAIVAVDPAGVVVLPLLPLLPELPHAASTKARHAANDERAEGTRGSTHGEVLS